MKPDSPKDVNQYYIYWEEASSISNHIEGFVTLEAAELQAQTLLQEDSTNHKDIKICKLVEIISLEKTPKFTIQKA